MGEIIIATRHQNQPVRKGDKLAGMRVIPLVIAKEKIIAAQAIASAAVPLVRILPYRKLLAAVVITGGEVYHGRIKDTFSDVIFDKLAAYNCTVTGHAVVDDSVDMIAAAMQRFADADLILCTGGMSVDPDDLTPTAIREYGAEIITYGAPVLPGAMFLLAYKGGQTVMGLPSCAMYAKTTIFDLMLPRALAGEVLTAADVRHLWHGGLCLACGECRFPDCSFGKGN